MLVKQRTKVIDSLVSLQRGREEDVRRPHGKGMVLFPGVAARLPSLAVLDQEADDHVRVC